MLGPWKHRDIDQKPKLFYIALVVADNKYYMKWWLITLIPPTSDT